MRTTLVAAAVAAILMPASPSVAGEKADELFEKAKKLQAKKKYADACELFEKVDALEPAIGAKLNTGRCFEEWGKLSQAYDWYVQAEKLAKATADKRAPKIKELIQNLDPEVPRLTIRAPDGTDFAAAAITLDGEPVPVRYFNAEQRVDPGPHVLVYKVGTKDKSKTVALERGGAREVTLDLSDTPDSATKPDVKVVKDKVPDKQPDEGDGTPLPPPPRPDPGRSRRWIGLGVAGAGVVGVGVASILTLSARGKYTDALDAHCMGDKTMCNDEGLTLTADARSTANVATVITLVGVAAVAGGIVLYVTAPKQRPLEKAETALYVAPVFGDRSGGIVFGGGF